MKNHKIDLLIALMFTGMLAASSLSAANTAKFTQKLADKLKAVTSEGSTDIYELESWSWTFVGKVYGNFTQFDDSTPISIYVGDFYSDATSFGSTIGEIKSACDATYDANDKMKSGKYKIESGKGGSVTYYFVNSYSVTVGENDIDKYKKNGMIFLKWDKKAFSFAVKVNVSPSDNYNGISDPGLAVAIEELEEPEGDTAAKADAKCLGTIPCQARFGDVLYFNSGLGFIGKKTVSRVLKGPKDDQTPYILHTHTVKERKGTTELLPPDLPVAVNDSETTGYLTGIDCYCTANDISDIDGSIYVNEITQNPKNGIATVSEDKDYITYLPNVGFIGEDSFSYTIKDELGRDGTNEGTVTVFVGVKNFNNAPFAVTDVRDLDDGAALNTPIEIDVLKNDSDLDGDALSIVSVSAPENGKAAIVEKTVDGKKRQLIYYAPFTGYASEQDAPDYFQYNISDGKGQVSTGEVFVFVGIHNLNNSPVAADDSAAVSSNSFVLIDVLLNDTDPESDMLDVQSVTPIEPFHGTLSIENGKVGYTPNPGFHGQDRFEYVVTDGFGYNPDRQPDASKDQIGTVSVTVNAPPVPYDDMAEIKTDETRSIDVLANDKDADGDPLSVASIVVPPANGNALVAENGKDIIYQPNSGFTGVDVFEYSVSDGIGESIGDVAVYVGVPYGNNDPSAVADNIVVESGEALSSIINALENDFDPDPDQTASLRIMDILVEPQYGTAINNGNNIEYVAADYSGQDSLTYIISDGFGGTATATVTITVDKLPLCGDDVASTAAGTPTAPIDVLANDFDPDQTAGVPLQLKQIQVQPTNGTAVIVDGKIVYTPNEGFTGEDKFAYAVQDEKGLENTATVTVTVQ